MAGRAHGDEGIVDTLRHHLVDRLHGAAGSPHHGLECAGIHDRVGIEAGDAFGWRGFLQRHEVSLGMDAQDRLARHHRRGIADQLLEPLLLEDALDDPDAVRPFGMARTHVVPERCRVGEKQGVHARRSKASTRQNNPVWPEPQVEVCPAKRLMAIWPEGA